jgi:hypothetical protein
MTAVKATREHRQLLFIQVHHDDVLESGNKRRFDSGGT